MVMQFTPACPFLLFLSPCAEEGKVPPVPAHCLLALLLRVLWSSMKACHKTPENGYNQGARVLWQADTSLCWLYPPGIHQHAVSGWRDELTQGHPGSSTGACYCSSQQPNFTPAAAVNESIGTVKQKKGEASMSIGSQHVVGGWGRRGQHHPFSQVWPAELRGSTCSCYCWE